MVIRFYKYHGTGNDFILVDNREGILKGDENSFFAAMCHRRLGIGADGVILLNPHPGYDFEMDYFNSDGHRSSMCGNGGRCIVQLAADLGLIQGRARFLAIDGPHEAMLTGSAVKLRMGMPQGFREWKEGHYWIHTGSPHYVQLLKTPVAGYDVVAHGRAIRNSEPWKDEGTNVNFVQVIGPSEAHVRTYERGVEDETWSCGTGVTAVAEVLARLFPKASPTKTLHTPGGTLRVHTSHGAEPWLEGAATFVFEGNLPMHGKK
jgi:diaminopimelate epimerase